jgi:hypothetical protein
MQRSLRPCRRAPSSHSNCPLDGVANECWQSDITHVLLADGSEVEIANFIDDHSRLCVASVAKRIFTSKT